MRIITGIHKNRLITTPKSLLRPTTTKVREAVFNILETRFPDNLIDANVLDLCSGSGSFGLEALSRGAKLSYFVDIDPAASSTIQKNVDNLKERSRTKIINEDARYFNSHDKFDLVFLDPPYSDNLYEEILLHIKNRGFLNSNAVIIIESLKKDNKQFSHIFNEIMERNYGNTKISFMTNA